MKKISTKKPGKLIVISGLPGAGKDALFQELISRFPSFKRIVTYTDRPPREGEINGVHHHFVSPEILDEIHRKGELIEDPVVTGPSRKATPKSEFKKVLHEGHSCIWRIDPSLAAKVAKGEFFSEKFSANESILLQESTTVLFLTAPSDDLAKRRKLRDGEKHNPADYKEREAHELAIFHEHKHVFKHVIENKEGKLTETVSKVIEITSIKNRNE